MEYRHWERELTEWRSPDEMHELLDIIRLLYGTRLLTGSETQFYRDAYRAETTGRRHGAEKVRLVASPHLGFEIESAGKVQFFSDMSASLHDVGDKGMKIAGTMQSLHYIVFSSAEN